MNELVVKVLQRNYITDIRNTILTIASFLILDSTLTNATPTASSGCSFKDFTATASAQVQQIAACATAVGDVTIQGDSFGDIQLTGLEQFYGDLHVNNATKAVTVNAPTLQLVSGELNSTVTPSCPVLTWLN